MSKPTRYVIGFLFNESLNFVVMIHKNRPAWMAGYITGVGGHIEDTDASPAAAMSREMLEETGLEIPADKWLHVARMRDIDETFYEMHVFAAKGALVWGAMTKTDEEVCIVAVQDVLVSPGAVGFGRQLLPAVFNVPWMMAMALSQISGRSLINQPDGPVFDIKHPRRRNA